MEETVVVYALNIVATPHPQGIYIEALRKASRYYAPLRGSDFAKITTPTKHREREDIYYGRILVWTEIDKRGRWLNLKAEDDLPENIKRQIKIPDGAKPNYRVFNYVFDERKHILYFESRNEFGERLGPTTGRRFFSRLMEESLLIDGDYDVNVTIVPDETAVGRILDMPRLRKLVIRISRPNPDTTASPARRRIYQELNDANAKQVEITYTKAAGAESLTATDNIVDEANHGANDGFVKGFGYDINDQRSELSTDAIPKKYTISQDSGGSFVARLMVALGLRR